MLDTIAKIAGLDFELSNSLTIRGRGSARPEEAAERLLAQIPGVPHRSGGGTAIEWGRRFDPNSSLSAYIDSGHLELNLPETRGAREISHRLLAALHLANRARLAALEHLPTGANLTVLANCSDGRTAWGSHLNLLLRRDAFQNLLFRKVHHAGCFATHLVTSVIYTGQGMVGAANGRPACGFQLAQRADWFDRMFGEQTMYDRPLLNQRAEHHASADLARLHIIYFDCTWSPVANLLKVGTTQLIGAMLEGGWLDATLQLDDPLAAASAISRDLDLNQRFPTVVRGQQRSAIELQQGLAELAGQFVADGLARDIVPEAESIVALWLETLDLLRRRELEALARRCDAWLKYLLLDRQRVRLGLDWNSNRLKVLDLQFANVDPQEGLFLQLAQQGFIEQWPSAEELQRVAAEPPEDTRAWLRAHVLRRYGEHVTHVDWSYLEFQVPIHRYSWSVARMEMPDPRACGRADAEPLLANCGDSVLELVEAVADAVGEPLPNGTQSLTPRYAAGWN